jgi:hypothetical protein
MPISHRKKDEMQRDERIYPSLHGFQEVEPESKPWQWSVELKDSLCVVLSTN